MCSHSDTDLIRKHKQYVVQTYKEVAPDVVLVSGSGCWYLDSSGRRFLNFTSAYSAQNWGIINDNFVKALTEQAQTLPLTSRALLNNVLPQFAYELCSLFEYDQMIPMNSGAEAVETAIKVARRWGIDVKNCSRGEIVVFSNNFAGRTITIISFYSEDPDVEARRGFGPFTPGFKISKFNDVEDLKSKVNDTTIAVLLEPIQGEGGIIPAEPSFYSLIHELSKKFNFLVIADEIQCGLFRAGTLTCSEQYNIKPDILILGKSLGGGLIPLSAVLANSHIFAPMGIGSHGSTYGGSPLASRVGLEVVRFISKNRENLEMQITHKGKMLTEALLQLKSKHPIISDVRGKGLMLGLELECSVDQFVKKCFELGLILGKTRSNTVRLTPPLVISEDELYFAVECIDKALSCIDLSCC